jgi:hypothetical protein
MFVQLRKFRIGRRQVVGCQQRTDQCETLRLRGIVCRIRGLCKADCLQVLGELVRTSIIEPTLSEGLAIGRKRWRQSAVKTGQVNLSWANTVGVAHHRVIPKSREELAEIEEFISENTTFVSFNIDKPLFLVFLKDSVDVAALTKANCETGGLKQVMPTAICIFYSKKDTYFKPIAPTLAELDTNARHREHVVCFARFKDTEEGYGCTYLIVQQTRGHSDRVCASKADATVDLCNRRR